MKKGYKHPVQETYKANPTSSHPGERILAYRRDKPKGAVDKATKVKQELGVDSWQKLCDYVTGNGAEKYIETLEELGQKEYVIAFNAILEYIKPKLIRNNNVNVEMKIDNISFE